YENSNSSKSEIENAELLLEETIKKLVKKPDKTSLLSTYSAAKILLDKEIMYTKESWNNFITEFNNVKNLIDSAEATEQQVAFSEKNLIDAINKLEKETIVVVEDVISEESLIIDPVEENIKNSTINDFLNSIDNKVLIISVAALIIIILLLIIIKIKKKKKS
ncbi:MAG: hypothetical protein K0S55_1987, partial [Clostridia bacterium]|nr:hypothetical protein [Clostridia bacterium]